MKRPFTLFLLLVSILGANSLKGAEQVRTDTTIRQPVWAGSFYPADRAELEKLLAALTASAKKTKISIPPGKALRALILPHAGYIYSGRTGAHASLVLSPHQFSRVVLLGPDHRIGFANAAVSDVSAYQTPLGLVPLHGDAARIRHQSDLFRAIPASDRAEHSIEVVLPFLQFYLQSFELVPVVMGHGDPKDLADTLQPLLDSNTLLTVSSDLSHFLPYSEAVARDRKTIDSILNLKIDILAKNDNRACGAIPILVTMIIAGRLGWQPALLHYSNSGDTAGNRTSVVGYAAIAFYGDEPMHTTKNSRRQFSHEQGQVLTKLARMTIMNKLGKKIPAEEQAALSTVLRDEKFNTRCGTFVTLHSSSGQLRGCMGCLTPSETVLEGIQRNALNAAFHDPRFGPLTADEAETVDIEISILSEPQPLVYSDGNDLLAKLRPHVDGVTIRKGTAGATFLPQVWKQLPHPEDFLSHLCRKAGLPPDSWQKEKLEVQTYQVQHFEEL